MRKSGVVRILLVALVILAIPAVSFAQISVGVSVRIGPPALPVYVQPVCPGVGYIWTPGYWAYGPNGYYWVPGTWVVSPRVGFLWTPGYWGWGGGVYVWHAGYWGPHIGFYGGINYGFGYGGVGYVGGYWHHGVFAYNTAVTNVNTTVIHNTYVNKTVINNVTVNRVSYNGGTGGIAAQPTPAETAAEHEQHVAATSAQVQHEHLASSNRALLASENHGRPSIAATSKPGEFTGHGVVAARPEMTSHNANSPHNNSNAASPNRVNPNGSTVHPKNQNVSPNKGNTSHNNMKTPPPKGKNQASHEPEPEHRH
jgi:hypothetical protein